MKETVDLAVSLTASAAPEPELSLGPQPTVPAVEVFDDGLEAIDQQEKTTLALEMEEAALGRDDRVVKVRESTYGETTSRAWLVNSLGSRNAASVEIATLLRKPEALTMPVEPRYVGWDIPNEFGVGYGLDYREKYRNLRDIGTLAPHVYS